MDRKNVSASQPGSHPASQPTPQSAPRHDPFAHEEDEADRDSHSSDTTLHGAPAEVLSNVEERFEHWRRVVGFVLTPVAFGSTWLLTKDSLTPQGARLSAILAAVGVLWVTESIPLAVTAILGAVLSVALGVGSAKAVLAPFADPIIFVFLGGFMLARAMTLHRLDRRIAFGFLGLPFIGGHPARVMAGYGLVTALISMWVSNTATTAMMLPIGLGILQALNQSAVDPTTGHTRSLRRWPFATGMMLMVAYSASVAGICTPVGSPPNLITIGFIRQFTGRVIPFHQWMALMLPIFAMMAVVLFLLLYLLHRPDPAPGPGDAQGDLRDYLRRQSNMLGPWTRGQVNTLIAFGVAVALWITPGIFAAFLPPDHRILKFFNANLPEGIAAVLAAILLFVLPVNLAAQRFTLSWDEAVKIDWGTILLFGGGLSLGQLMTETGVATAMGKALANLTGAQSLWALTAAAIAIGIVLSETTSNTAAANMLIPMIIPLAKEAGVSPLPPALGACLGASYGFMLPVSTPPNAIAYGSGLVPIPKMVRAGFLFDIFGFFIILAGLRVMCPLLGLM